MNKNSDLRRENAELKSALVNIRREIAELKIMFRDLKMENADLKMENADLKNKVTKLTNTLAYYDNSNVPPSHNTLTQQAVTKQKRTRNNGDEKTAKKSVGGQKGHKGRTNKPKPTEFKTYTPKQCPKCKTESIEIVKTVKEIVTDIAPPPPPVTTEYTIKIAKCKQCNRTIVPKTGCAELDGTDSKLVDDTVVLTRRQLESDSNKNKKLNKQAVTITPLIVDDKNQVKDEEFRKDMYSQFTNTENQLKPQIDILPNYGHYGKNIQMLMIQYFLNRMPIRMIADNLNERGVQISTGAVCNNLSAIGMHLTRPTGRLLDTIRQASVLHIDETSMSLNGENIWVWIFFDPYTDTVLYVLAASRGRNVLQEVLHDWNGTIVCDGWGSYKKYIIQRCWAHIIREAKDLAVKYPDDKQAQSMLKHLRRIYERACNVKGLKKKRSRTCKLLLRSIEHLLSKYTDMPLFEKFITKLGNAKNDLFRFVMNPNIPPTNNAAERGLREIVVHRKIRGSIRSIQSMVSFGNLLSCAETWKLRDMKYLEEMVKYS